jgi:dolichol kinase
VGHLPLIALAAAAGGAVGELLAHEDADDNLVIPLCAAGAAWLAHLV